MPQLPLRPPPKARWGKGRSDAEAPKPATPKEEDPGWETTKALKKKDKAATRQAKKQQEETERTTIKEGLKRIAKISRGDKAVWKLRKQDWPSATIMNEDELCAIDEGQGKGVVVLVEEITEVRSLVDKARDARVKATLVTKPGDKDTDAPGSTKELEPTRRASS